ncbi:hypothetical protein ABVK25_012385 [Lepraria finkii]|uniref:Uncharacterized protein n=1 Tax=Lepraria finkii TaxID=1340010 RepID=A0ABR4AFF9_9LECA
MKLERDVEQPISMPSVRARMEGGDAAMTVWEEEEAKIDAESDDEALRDKMDVS